MCEKFISNNYIFARRENQVIKNSDFKECKTNGKTNGKTCDKKIMKS